MIIGIIMITIITRVILIVMKITIPMITITIKLSFMVMIIGVIITTIITIILILQYNTNHKMLTQNGAYYA